jgi:hypothetical protein
MPVRSILRRASLGAVLLFVATACATTGATFRSGVGDTFLAQPPYYAGARTTPAAVAGTRVGILPVHFQPGAAQASIFDPRWGAESPMAALLEEMNAYLDSLTTSTGAAPVRLITGLSPATTLAPKMGTAPDVRFGCITELDLPGEECAEPGDSALGRSGPRMKLAVGRPSAEWVAWAGGAMDEAQVSHALVITLEVGQYLMKQKGIVGRKSVELGTAHEVALPWMTSLETPVTVLQLTGALMDRNGKAVRIGAEGIVAKRTRLLVSSMRAQEVLSDEDVAAVRTRRREDLPGQPLAWREAMRQLVAHLTRQDSTLVPPDQAGLGREHQPPVMGADEHLLWAKRNTTARSAGGIEHDPRHCVVRLVR